MPIVQTVTTPLMSHFPPCLVDPTASLSDTAPFYPVCKACETCVVTGTDGHIAARDTEKMLTCIFDSELQGMFFEGSTHPCKLAPCDLNTFLPSSTRSHDGPNAVLGEFCTDNCFDGNAAISRTDASTAWTCDAEGALVSDRAFPCSSCRGSSIVDMGMVFCGRVPGRFQRYLNLNMFAQQQ